MEGVKIANGVRKTKNKKMKDEFDRIKQAEKKMRRLEKALATSAAIRSELEKKKQKKKEQERLDEEGAAIAEAVALHVLLGEESDDSCKVVLKKKWPNTRDFDSNIGIFTHRRQSLVSCPDLPTYPHEDHGWTVDPHTCGSVYDNWGSSNLMASNPFDRGIYHQYLVEEDWGSVGVSADHLVAQVVSSLQIADDASYAFNHFLKE